MGRRLGLRPQTDLDQPAICSPDLPFNGLHPRNNYMDYFSFTDPGGMEGWVGLVGWPVADTLPTKWSHVNHRSGIDRRPNHWATPPTTITSCGQSAVLKDVKTIVHSRGPIPNIPRVTLDAIVCLRNAEVSKTPEDKERARRQQLRRLKQKFGLTVCRLADFYLRMNMPV